MTLFLPFEVGRVGQGLITEQLHVIGFHHVGMVDVFLLAGVEDDAVVDADVMNHIQGAFGGDADAGVAASDMTDVDVAELRDELLWLLACNLLSGFAACRTVGIRRLEDDGLVSDVAHSDVADMDVAGLSATARTAFEAQTGVGAGKGAVVYHDAVHAARELRADDESAMGMKYCVAGDENIGAGSVFHSFHAHAALKADTVVAHIEGTGGDEHPLALHEVDAVTILCVPGTANGDSVDDDVFASLGYDVEFRRILHGHPLDEDALAVGHPDEVGAHTLLCFGCFGNVGKMLELVWIPQLSVVGLCATHRQEKFPFRITYLAVFDCPPPFTIAVDDAFSGNADVMAFAGCQWWRGA